METVAARIDRFLRHGFEEIVDTVTNGIQNQFFPELRHAADSSQFRLLVLGTHAVIQTLEQYVFDTTGPAATAHYLEQFVDGAGAGERFSDISEELHTHRNVLGHRWLARSGHRLAISPGMAEGWKRVEDVLHINPEVYWASFEAPWRAGGAIWDIAGSVPADQHKVRTLVFLRKWLELPDADPLNKRVADVRKEADPGRRERLAEAAELEIRRRFTP